MCLWSLVMLLDSSCICSFIFYGSILTWCRLLLQEEGHTSSTWANRFGMELHQIRLELCQTGVKYHCTWNLQDFQVFLPVFILFNFQSTQSIIKTFKQLCGSLCWDFWLNLFGLFQPSLELRGFSNMSSLGNPYSLWLKHWSLGKLRS